MLADVIAAAAGAGGTAVAEAAGSDLWGWFRTRCARLVGRGDPAREREALDRLDRTAAVLAAASDDGERSRVRDRYAGLWEGEFASLLLTLEEPEREPFLTELRAMVREFGPPTAVTGGGPVTGNTFHGPVAFQTGGGANRQENHFGGAG